MIRPHTLEFFRAVKEFFEILVFTKLHFRVINQIIKKLESNLNEQTIENIQALRKNT